MVSRATKASLSFIDFTCSTSRAPLVNSAARSLMSLSMSPKNASYACGTAALALALAFGSAKKSVSGGGGVLALALDRPKPQLDRVFLAGDGAVFGVGD